MKFGYARVSTDDQNLDLQVDALKAAGCNKILTEKASGAKTDRKALATLLESVRDGDTVIVWKLDRLARSIRQLIDTVDMLKEKGVQFVSLQDNIDTTTPGGELVFHIFGALAQFERAMIIDRTKAGLAAARARGRFGGRPRVLSGPKRSLARSMMKSGDHTVTEIADHLGVSRATLYRSLNTSSLGSQV
ncbi:MAG: recombinase family protein [bacterium]|nr:recombinase family protein [bacterium]